VRDLDTPAERLQKWFADEIADLQLGMPAFDILERHFPEAEADYRQHRKHCTQWSHVCWEIGRSLRLRLPDTTRENSLGRVLADLADFCSNLPGSFSRLLFELCEGGPLPDRVHQMLPVLGRTSRVLEELAELHRRALLQEEELRRMDQMGY